MTCEPSPNDDRLAICLGHREENGRLLLQALFVEMRLNELLVEMGRPVGSEDSALVKLERTFAERPSHH